MLYSLSFLTVQCMWNTAPQLTTVNRMSCLSIICVLIIVRRQILFNVNGLCESKQVSDIFNNICCTLYFYYLFFIENHYCFKNKDLFVLSSIIIKILVMCLFYIGFSSFNFCIYIFIYLVQVFMNYCIHYMTYLYPFLQIILYDFLALLNNCCLLKRKSNS